jgi:hypothetical protein
MIKSSFIALLLLVSFVGHKNSSNAQNLFDINDISTVEIFFYDSNWDHLLDSLATLNSGTGSGTGRILADVIIDGQSYDSCGVRFKGNSSMDVNSDKNPFNIDLNYTIASQEHLGKDKIKLANCFTDPSMVREALMYEISNQYMDCPIGTFVKLYINNDYRGIYTNTESVDNEFLDAYYGSSNNSFFKCDPNSFDLFGDNSNLAYHADTIAYDTLYDKKSLYGLTELQTLCFNLENNSVTLDQYLDIDRALWFLALSSAFVHNDGYSAFAHNYYVYKMDNGRWSIILWDVNMAFGGLLWNGTNLLPMNINDLREQDPYLHETNFNLRPLISRLLSIPKYKRMYVAHYRTILEENIDNGYYLQRAEFMHNLIDSDVQNEPYSSYSYSDFTTNLLNNVGTGANMRPGLGSLMEARKTYLNGLSDFQLLQPTISSVSTNPVEPPPFTLVTFNATVSNENSVTLGYRQNHFDVFTKVPMYDDGLHDDGASGDGVYGVEVSILAADMEYYIYAENATAAKFSPVRAEYEFHTVSTEKGLVVNELSAINNNIVADQDGEFDDWIELYNNSTSAIDLSGYHLSDDGGNLSKWAFPSLSINPGEYLIIWADADTLQTGLHANFKLSAGGEAVYLVDDLGFIIDQVVFPVQQVDPTYGRFPNGVGNFTYLYPTFNSENTTEAFLEIEENEISLTVYPNPAVDMATIQFSQEVDTEINVFDLSGKLVLSKKMVGLNELKIDVSEFNPGLYLIYSSTGGVNKLIVR